MQLKIKLFGAAALLGAAMLVNANMGTSEESQNVSLTELVNATEANAECHPSKDYSASGKCLKLSQICVFAVGYRECDPYEM